MNTALAGTTARIEAKILTSSNRPRDTNRKPAGWRLVAENQRGNRITSSLALIELLHDRWDILSDPWLSYRLPRDVNDDGLLGHRLHGLDERELSANKLQR